MTVAFEFQPTLKGGLVVLRPLSPDDFQDLYAVASDPLIWEQHPVKSRHELHAFQKLFDESLASGGALIVIDAETNKVIGSSRYHGFDPAKREIEIGWTFLARTHWGGRYNGEMKYLMLTHAFRFVDSVIFLVGLENTRSQRAVEKIGAVRVATRPDGGGNPSYVYRIAASDYAGQV
jgi:RimJ/RimL family protein N-acetyltransferase